MTVSTKSTRDEKKNPKEKVVVVGFLILQMIISYKRRVLSVALVSNVFEIIYT